jgi:hypothetical protein
MSISLSALTVNIPVQKVIPIMRGSSRLIGIAEGVTSVDIMIRTRPCGMDGWVGDNDSGCG